MTNPLVPTISGQTLSMSALLNNPTRMNQLVARISADQLVADAFFRGASGTVSGGGMVYDVLLHGQNFTARDVASRPPGGEYIVTMGDLTRDLATPQDWGAKVLILDEELERFDLTVSGNKIVGLANTITRKIDQLAFAAVDAALTKYSIASVPGNDWGALTTVGPLDAITPNSERPTADIANAALLVRSADLGIRPPDTLICHPNEQTALRIGYGSELTDVLASVGITSVRTSMQCPVGTAYVCPYGAAGVLGFEHALTTEVIPYREVRGRWVQSFAVPCFAIPLPGAIRKITGLAG